MWGGVGEAFSRAGRCCTVELSWAGPLIRTRLIPASQAALRDSGLGAHLIKEEIAVQGASQPAKGQDRAPGWAWKPSPLSHPL